MSTLLSGSTPAGVRLGAVDRYLVPVSERRVLDYFVERLFVAHGVRERLLRAVLVSPLGPAARGLLFDATWLAGPAPYRLRPEGAPLQGDEAERWRRSAALVREIQDTPEALDAAGIRPLVPGRSIILRDYDDAGRGRLLVFPFRPGASEPAAVVKLRDPHASGAPLRREHDALQRVRTRPEMRASVPEPLFYGATESAEILVLSAVPGTSAYVDMQTSLRPARMVATHFQAAAGWLAGFHRAFADGDGDLAGAPAHGDYWARNLLLRPRPGGDTGVAVVDWEHFSETGDPLRDLFHFPVTYGLNYPWRRYRRCPAPEAFRRTFLSASGLAPHVARYFRRYVALTGLREEGLRPGLLAYLRDRARTAEPGREGDWEGCARALASSGSTVLDA
ncbi:MAG TPA: hypothetical protein VMK65_04025 [Longimicrobiales bacterium]|nr:hypothetical protein [Longimicrobiales bacterium]